MLRLMSCPLLRRLPLFFLLCIGVTNVYAQDLSGIEIHGFVTQGFLFTSHNNYLTMQSSSGSAQWTDGTVSFTDPLTDKLRVGIQLHMYQLGQLGGPNLQVDWASGDYRINDHLGFRVGKVKTALGLFNDSQDVDAVFLWVLLPQCSYPIDNKSSWLAHEGGDVYGDLPLGNHAGKLAYRGYVGYFAIDLNGGYAKQLADLGLSFTTAPGGKTYGGDLRWEAPLNGLIVGSSAEIEAMNGTGIGGSVHVAPYLISAQYAQFTRGKFYFAGEYDRTPVNPVLTIDSVSFPAPWDVRSWYAMASYRLCKNFHVGSYYSHYINKALNTALPANYSKDWVVSGRYDINANMYAKIEAHFQRGNGLSYYTSTNPDGLKPNSNMLAAKIGFSF